MGLHGRPAEPHAARRKGQARRAPCPPVPTSLVSPWSPHSSLRHPSPPGLSPVLQDSRVEDPLLNFPHLPIPFSLALSPGLLPRTTPGYLPTTSPLLPQCLDPDWCPILSSPPLALQPSDRPTASAQRLATAATQPCSQPLLVSSLLLKPHLHRHHHPHVSPHSIAFFLDSQSSLFYYSKLSATAPSHRPQPQTPATDPIDRP